MSQCKAIIQLHCAGKIALCGEDKPRDQQFGMLLTVTKNLVLQTIDQDAEDLELLKLH